MGRCSRRPKRFSGPTRGYRGSFLSFATGIEAVPEEWHEWRERFEQLLGVLECNAAQARFEFEDDNEGADYNYVFAEFFSGDAPPPRATGRRRCARFLSEPGDDGEEVELLL